MGLIGAIYHEALYRPALNALVVFYNILPFQDLGITIILFTVFVRILLLPLSIRAARSQKQLAALQPKIREAQERFKHNKERQTREVMALYRQHRVNPIGGCLPLLLQFPLLIALYQIFLSGLSPDNFGELYSFISPPAAINQILFGLINLTKPSPILAIVAGLSQFALSRLMMVQQKGAAAPVQDFAKALSWQMTYFFPAFTVFLAWTFPAGVTTYWITTTLFSLGQQYAIGKMTVTRAPGQGISKP